MEWPTAEDFGAWRKADDALDAMERGDYETGIRLMREANASQARMIHAKNILLPTAQIAEIPTPPMGSEGRGRDDPRDR